MAKGNIKLTIKDVSYVAKLARLQLSEEEIFKFQKQLSSIVTYINQLSEIDTQGVEPTSQTTGLDNVSDEDEIVMERILGQNEALSGTDKKHKAYFVVPMVLENK